MALFAELVACGMTGAVMVGVTETAGNGVITWAPGAAVGE
jgi:hypothetical protein